jgi:glycerol-3-phosphate dehydrogenase
VLSAFAGIRPLVGASTSENTAALSRDHAIQIDRTGLVTITGGKWTTYRHMAEDCVNQAATLGRLPERPCLTRDLKIHGYRAEAASLGHLRVHGSDAPAILDLSRAEPALAETLHPALPYRASEVVWAVRKEMARTVEDVLARRTRALFLNARAALAMAPRVARLMGRELGWDTARQAIEIDAFNKVTGGYLV